MTLAFLRKHPEKASPEDLRHVCRIASLAPFGSELAEAALDILSAAVEHVELPEVTRALRRLQLKQGALRLLSSL